MNGIDLALAIAAGIVLSGVALWLADRIIPVIAYRVRNFGYDAERRREAERRQVRAARQRAENEQRFLAELGPFRELVDAIAASPQGRWSIPYGAIAAYPAPVPRGGDLERYLFDRFPGLELLRTADGYPDRVEWRRP